MKTWSEGLTRRIMSEVKRRRDALGLLQGQLAERTEDVGAPISRGTIAKLESGERKQITMPEVLALAAALDTAPLLLIAPLDAPQDIEVLPGKVLPAAEAYTWLTEGSGTEATGGVHPVDYDQEPRFGEQAVKRLSALAWINDHKQLVNMVTARAARVGASRVQRRKANERGDHGAASQYTDEITAGVDELDRLWRSLANARTEMRKQGFAVPVLPRTLAPREEAGGDDLPWGLEAGGSDA